MYDKQLQTTLPHNQTTLPHNPVLAQRWDTLSQAFEWLLLLLTFESFINEILHDLTAEINIVSAIWQFAPYSSTNETFNDQYCLRQSQRYHGCSKFACIREINAVRIIKKTASVKRCPSKDFGSVGVKSIHEPLNKAIPPGRHSKFGRYIA